MQFICSAKPANAKKNYQAFLLFYLAIMLIE